ncbi:hypothetical protein OUZ56_009006 [Daphnia magna]|uniref:Uncharacterized protein n=1 Tax=Daphnia magna TaxID=35525 RepID=A0ABR0AER7_9CRUS|nr:hypothetical protein OUZ56_009006 [Daphnia magna]
MTRLHFNIKLSQILQQGRKQPFVADLEASNTLIVHKKARNSTSSFQDGNAIQISKELSFPSSFQRRSSPAGSAYWYTLSGYITHLDL